MAFQVPSLSDVSRTIENGFSTAFYGKSGVLRVGVLKVLSKVVAGGCYLPILFCQYIFRNSFIDSCDVENLVRFGGWYNLPHKVASYARAKLVFQSMEGATIPANTYVEDENGRRWYTLTDVKGDGTNYGIFYADAIAENVGSEYNVEQTDNEEDWIRLKFSDVEIPNVLGVILYKSYGGSSFDVPINGITEKWGESVEDYRARLKYRRQHPPVGGSDADYTIEAMKYSFVTDCHVIANYPDTNCVRLALANFNASSGMLTEEEVEEVASRIKSASWKPITADVSVVSAFPLRLSFNVKLDTNSESYRKAVLDILKTYLRKFKPGDTIKKSDVESEINRNGIGCYVSQMKVYAFSSSQYSVVDEYTLDLTESYSAIVNINMIERLVVFS